ncbi:MAG TPA: PmeII family type II restriction endonuclease [Pyrinomonadaceae bacterium]|jgi:site-specific DNA-methyltransferase (cytosine-N4-specific)|nr:PmeII family type II restriction endonuclease [Pyrinomonadaceae bacterium]
MNRPLYQDYYDYLAEHVITPFYATRLNNLRSLQLTNVLKRKNPYLFKAKNIELAGDMVTSIVDAFLSSQEESIFGNLMEGFAIYISKMLYSGFKSEFKSVDLEFRRDGVYHIVGIKSGTNWGNADQIARMRDNFKSAKEALRAGGLSDEIMAVNGCIYGRDRVPFKNHTDPDRQYYKYAGQEFWRFISGDDNLYREIITPIDREARQKDENFKKAYSAKINEMTQEFLTYFVTDNLIDWVKLVDYVSKRDKPL